MATLKKHIEQVDIYRKYKGKKPLTDTEQALFVAAHSYLKGVMNGNHAGCRIWNTKKDGDGIVYAYPAALS